MAALDQHSRHWFGWPTGGNPKTDNSGNTQGSAQRPNIDRSPRHHLSAEDQKPLDERRDERPESVSTGWPAARPRADA